MSSSDPQGREKRVAPAPRLITLADAEGDLGRAPHGPAGQSKPWLTGGAEEEGSRRRPASALSSRSVDRSSFSVDELYNSTGNRSTSSKPRPHHSIEMPLRKKTANLAARVYRMHLPGAAHALAQVKFRPANTTGKGWGISGVDGGRGERSSQRADEARVGGSGVSLRSAPLSRPGSASASSASPPSRMQQQQQRRKRPASAASMRGAEAGGDGRHHGGARPVFYGSAWNRSGSAGLARSSSSLPSSSPLVMQPRSRPASAASVREAGADECHHGFSRRSSRPASAASVREAGADECHHGFSRRSLNSPALSASVHSLRSAATDSSFSRSAVLKVSPYLSEHDRAVVLGQVFDQELRALFDLLARGDDYIARGAETAALQVMGLGNKGGGCGCDDGDDGDDDGEGWADWPSFRENVKARGGAKKLRGEMISDAIAKIEKQLNKEERERNRVQRLSYRPPLPRGVKATTPAADQKARVRDSIGDNDLSEILGPEDMSVNHSVVRRVPGRQRERPSSAPVSGGGAGAARGKGQQANQEGDHLPSSQVKLMPGMGAEVKWKSTAGNPMWPGHWPEEEERLAKESRQRRMDFAAFSEDGGVREHYEQMDKRERAWHCMVEKIFECDFWKDPTKNKVRVEAPPTPPPPLSEQERRLLDVTMEEKMDRTVCDLSVDSAWDGETVAASGKRKLDILQEFAASTPTKSAGKHHEGDAAAVVQLGEERARWLGRELEGMGLISDESGLALAQVEMSYSRMGSVA